MTQISRVVKHSRQPFFGGPRSFALLALSVVLGCSGKEAPPSGSETEGSETEGSETEGSETEVTTSSTTMGSSETDSVPDPIVCGEEPLALAVEGYEYAHELTASGGEGPYTWSPMGLPDGLVLDPDTGELSGSITVGAGQYPVSFVVSDSAMPPQSQACEYVLDIRPPLTIDSGALEATYGACIDVAQGPSIAELLANGIVSGGDESEILCSFELFEGNAQGIGVPGHGVLPSTITIADDCSADGMIPETEPPGTYAWIVNLTQQGTGQTIYLPFCAEQPTLHPDAYEISIDPDETVALAPLIGGNVSFGDEMQPRVDVERFCPNLSCFYTYYFTFSWVNGVAYSGEPSYSLPGPNGMSHAIRFVDTDVPEQYEGRYTVAPVRWDYCLFGSDQLNAQALNDAACGTKELAIENGDDSNLQFSLIVKPG